MRVGVHAYQTDPLLPQRDGVNFAHENFTFLLQNVVDPELEVEFHSFNGLIADAKLAVKTLRGLDCVFSNVGPHAHYYFWLREELGLNFRIVRDVRTAIWSSYLLQEYLIAPLLRPGDTLQVASHYVLGVYEHVFPHLAGYPSALCYPLGVAFPRPRPAIRERWPMAEEEVVIGYLGRLSDDKNFPDVVDLVVRLNRENASGLRYRLVACGDIHSPSCSPSQVAGKFAMALGDGDWYQYVPARPYEHIWDLLAGFDVLVFPSTSNLETFGRVLIEASYARVPVVAGRHAASPELVDPGNLCDVTYKVGKSFDSHFDHQLGRVDIAQMASLIRSGQVKLSDSYEHYSDHDQKFLSVLRSPDCAADRPRLTRSQELFIASLDVVLPSLPMPREACALLSQMAEWFQGLQRRGSFDYAGKIERLLEISKYKERTRCFAGKSRQTLGDFTNVGGIDIELCHLLNFYPRFSMRES